MQGMEGFYRSGGQTDLVKEERIMTKAEYMQHLKEALQGYDRSFAEEILESYEEHFADGIKSGRQKKKSVMKLGKIENFMKDIEDMMGDKGHPYS